jgi:hypothetical protein
MGRATPDQNSQFTVIGASSVDGTTPIELYVNPTNHAAYVELVAGTITGADGAILDGVDSDIKATILDYTNSNPLAVRLTNTDGDYVAAGAGTQYTEGDTDATIIGTAVMWEDAANTLVAVSAGKPLPVEVTDASVAVTGTFWQATQPVSIAGTVTVDGSGVTQPVSGTFWQATQPVSIAAAVAVTGTFWQATQPVSIAGTVTVDGSGVTQPVSGTVTANLSATDNAVLDAIALAVATEGDALGDGVLIQGDDGTDRTNVLVDTDGHLQVDVLAAPSTVVTATNLDIRDLTSTDVVTVTGGAGQTADVKITLDSEAVAVTGTFWQATQPVSGTVTANAGTNLNTSTLALEAGGNLAAAATSLGLLDNAVDGNYLNVNLNIAGTDVTGGAGAVGATTQRVTLASDDPAVTSLQLIDNAVSGAGFNITQVNGETIDVGAGTEAAAIRVTLPTDGTGYVKLGTGTNSIGKLGTANSGVDIGDVDVTSIVPGVGATNLGKAIDTALGATDTGVLALGVRDDTLNIRSGTENDVEPLHTDALGALWTDPQGNVAHDAADAGNPVKVGARAITALSGATMVAAADRSDLLADEDGVLLTKNWTTNNDILMERVSNTDGASTASTVFGATASTYNMITTIVVHNAHATTNGYVDIRDGTAGTVLMTIPAPANGGAVLNLTVPLRTSANTALAFDVSAAITTIYISFIGYKSKA